MLLTLLQQQQGATAEPPVARGLVGPVRPAKRPAPVSLGRQPRVVRPRRNPSIPPQTIVVSPVVVREVAVPPGLAPGVATRPVSPTALRLLAVPPARTASATVTVPFARVTLAGLPPAVSATVTRAVPAVAVRFVAVPAGVTPGVSTRPVPSSAVRLVAVPPAILGFIPVQVARLTLVAIEPAVSGGGGPLVVVLPRSSGEGVGSMAVLPPEE